jgi:hypothetical protein
MRKLFVALALLALAVTPVVAADLGEEGAVQINTSTSAVDTSPFVLIYYVGSDTTGVVTAQVADDTWTLLEGGAADESIECPLSGDYGGLLDVTNAACDTLGELMNVVNNTSGSNWRIVPINGQIDDDTDDAPLAKAATEARGDGVVVFYDDSVELDHKMTFIPGEWDDELMKPEFYDPGRDGVGLINPFDGATQVLKYATYAITSSGTMTDLRALCVVPKFGPTGTFTQTETVIYLEADATTGVVGLINEFNYHNGGLRCPNGRIMISLPTDTDLTAPAGNAVGFIDKTSNY